jgi:hypothetical protein
LQPWRNPQPPQPIDSASPFNRYFWALRGELFTIHLVIFPREPRICKIRGSSETANPLQGGGAKLPVPGPR